MAEGSWERSLPSAWAPQANPNAQVEAGNAAAASIATVAKTGSEIQTAAQDRIRKQALQDIMAQSIETTVGPDGKPRHHFSNEKFLSLLPKNKAAGDAYALWNEKINPANATVETQRAMAQGTTPEGGLDAAGLARSAQGNEYAGQILAAGRGIQQAQATAGTDIASNRFAQDKLVTGTTAQPGSLLYNEQVKPKSVGTGTTGAGRIDEAMVSKLSKSGREAALYNLKAKGIVLPPDASAKDIADAANTLADNEVARQSVTGADLSKPISLATAVFQAAGSEPSTRNKVHGEIFGNALDIVQQKQSIRSAGLGIQGGEQAQDQVQQLRNAGYNATPANVDKILSNKANVDWLRSTLHSVREMNAQVAKGRLDPDTFNNMLNTWLNAPQTAESINTESGREKFLSGLRPVKSLGAVLNEASDVKDVVRTLTAQNLGAQDQQVVLKQMENMLSEQLKSGQAINQDKQYKSKAAFKPSSFPSKGPIGSATNPYPQGQEPPVGSYYMNNGVLHKRLK